MKYKVVEKKNSFNGFFKIDTYSVQHELFSGGESEVFTRELFERGDAAAVLPYDPITDEVILVEQFRIGALRSKNSPWQIELIAGVLDKEGENPENVVLREAIEEANCSLENPKKICEYFCSPGGTSEKIYLYCAKVDATKQGGIFGLKEENEDIKVHVIKLNDAMKMIEDGVIETAMTIIALQWLSINKDIF